MERHFGRRIIVLLLCFWAGRLAHASEGLGPPDVQGPGLRRVMNPLKLPVPRDAELSHVRPEYFAAALEKDPQKIFAFMRGYIAFEAYPGCLRGARGTLMALAGNSIDRACLLSEMLKASGQKTRFVRGVLDEANARRLVQSMFADRQPLPHSAAWEVPADLRTFAQTLHSSVHRDYPMLRDQLRKAGLLKAPATNAIALARNSAP